MWLAYDLALALKDNGESEGALSAACRLRN